MKRTDPYKYVVGVDDGPDSFEACAIGVGLECDEISPEQATEFVSDSLQGSKNAFREEVLVQMEDVGSFFIVTTADDEDERHLDWLLEHPSAVFNHQIAGPADDEEEKDEERLEEDDWSDD